MPIVEQFAPDVCEGSFVFGPHQRHVKVLSAINQLAPTLAREEIIY